MSALIPPGTNDIIPFQEVADPGEHLCRCPVRSSRHMASSQELERAMESRLGDCSELSARGSRGDSCTRVVSHRCLRTGTFQN